MSASLIALALWVVVAWLLSVLLKPRQTWPAAYGLIAVGLPIVLWIWVSHGWPMALLGFGVACLVLRWPLIYLGRWLRGRFL